ncbi:N-acetyltransferase [Parashewanella spongiae]|uniref:N-acetyltransferase n=1 Tax=Parashewanella spongiae TaxID=342950 RepID=A0A3A6UNW4_9GAMM|nr:GNAT family N-acetyltransferase [Parashewanella spongiae]MCL1076728.1 GNAT family N-acetyltransferase [Parashewanella spongiae]RJY19510.1 N-acetyltransferase [Parashewanella spongiae]
MIVETERLILRKFTENDIDALFEMNRIPEILAYIPTEPFIKREQATKLYKTVILPNYEEFGFGRWAVHHKTDDKVIGFCGPKYIEELNEVELGYRYFPDYWGKGIGFEAAKGALSSFPEHGIKSAIAMILEGNVGSENIAKKVGMKWRNEDKFMGATINVFHKDL